MMMRRALGRRGAATIFELAPEMEGLVSLFKSGTDWILGDAPALVLFCADSAEGSFAGVNANLALHNVALAAETHIIYGALAMGYPRLKFKKWPERNPAKVTWV